ncbi:hypothetical protein PR202_gb08925 [Eleusine coracana subsp. coracana]|uniref:Uncharacterized protein n=1 Tax=Eleusine coracana subsp. coracana TaxID=191504 RepID=A0AAV5EH07_ELECO|nr:hypothetical protein PR202_gb08925 [Eleusine coracana subsp. coracana]
MAPAASTPATSTAVYVAAVPLRAPKGPGQLLMSAGYSLGLWDLQHFMVLLRPDPARTQVRPPASPARFAPSLLSANYYSTPPRSPWLQAVVFDFQPRDPEDVLAALAVLTRSEIPGVVRRRTLRRIPDRRCWLVGRCDGDAVGAADRFSERWPTGLVIGEHDCRDYTNGSSIVLCAVIKSMPNGDNNAIIRLTSPVAFNCF